MVFIYNALSILVLGILLNKKLENPKYKKIYLFICFFQMMVIQGLRNIDVGTDTSLYVNTYNGYLTSSYYSFQFTHFEYGFQVLYNIFHKLNINSQLMLIIISGITMFGFAYFIYRNSKNVYLSTFIFACMLYPNSFNIMRQYLALSIAINSYQLIINGKYLKGMLLIGIGALFHTTALLLVVPLVFYYIKNWKLLRNTMIVFDIICLLLGTFIVNNLLILVGKAYYITGYNVDRLFRLTTLITIIIAALTWYFAQKATDKKDKQILNYLTCISLFNVGCGILYLKYEFMSRIIELLNTFILVSIPLGLSQTKFYYKPLVKIGVYCIPFLLMLNSVFNSGSGIEIYKMFFMV